MSHSCSTMILHCMDFRLGSAIRDELDRRGILNDCDIVSIAGAGKCLVSDEPKSWHDCSLEMVDLSKKLHGIQKLIIMNHTDCGAYGGRGAFESAEAETSKHKEDLAKAAEVIKKRQPDLEVEQVLAHIALDDSISFETV